MKPFNPIGKRIKKLRIDNALTKVYLAKSAKIDVGTLTQIEKNRYLPSFHSLVGLAQAFEISLDELVDESFDPTKGRKYGWQLENLRSDHQDIIKMLMEMFKHQENDASFVKLSLTDQNLISSMIRSLKDKGESE